MILTMLDSKQQQQRTTHLGGSKSKGCQGILGTGALKGPPIPAQVRRPLGRSPFSREI